MEYNKGISQLLLTVALVLIGSLTSGVISQLIKICSLKTIMFSLSPLVILIILVWVAQHDDAVMLKDSEWKFTTWLVVFIFVLMIFPIGFSINEKSMNQKPINDSKIEEISECLDTKISECLDTIRNDLEKITDINDKTASKIRSAEKSLAEKNEYGERK